MIRWGPGHISSGYGYRVDPFTGRLRMHHGVDIAAPMWTPIRAPFRARVAAIGHSESAGEWVALEWPERGAPVFLVLAHLSGQSVRAGQIVARGSLLGWIGMTGRATGPHVHVELSTPAGSRAPTFHDLPLLG